MWNFRREDEMFFWKIRSARQQGVFAEDRDFFRGCTRRSPVTRLEEIVVSERPAITRAPSARDAPPTWLSARARWWIAVCLWPATSRRRGAQTDWRCRRAARDRLAAACGAAAGGAMAAKPADTPSSRCGHKVSARMALIPHRSLIRAVLAARRAAVVQAETDRKPPLQALASGSKAARAADWSSGRS